MALFRSKSGAIAMLHTSLTQWKNLFSFEVFGSEGYIQAEGLGGSYGVEKLTFGKRDFTGPFLTKVTEFKGSDPSWKLEWDEFRAAVREKREPIGNVKDGLESMRMALAVYESEKKGRFVSLKRKS
jgi:predicted dehydrogenase